MKTKALVPLVCLLALSLLSIPVSASEHTVAYTGIAGPDSSQGAYTDTWADEMTNYDGIKDTAGEAYVILNFSISPFTHLLSFNYSVFHAAHNGDDGNSELWVYDWSANDWAYLGDGGIGFASWTNGSVSGSQYSEGSQISIMANSTDADSSAGVAVVIAHLHNIDAGDWHPYTASVDIRMEGWKSYIAIVGILIMFPEGVIQAWMVFLGLIMIPASSLYLVRGGREKASINKLFFALVIFFMGIGLLVGGIMP